jgi:catechol 2,3-dioxygenase-like lactoylglutathione lyase family enzyme
MQPRVLNDLMSCDPKAPPVQRLARFGLTTQNIERLVRFFVGAFDCQEAARGRRSGFEFEQLMGVRGGASSVTLRLGISSIEILEFDQPGNPYVQNLSPFDNEFQHFALVVDDMDAAFSRLSSADGWSDISAGPQQLPPSSGGVTAFKFRDPDGHPLELLRFPQDRVPDFWRAQPGRHSLLGIDHSAVSCKDAARSIAFYRKIGLEVAARSFNHGIEQQRLDGIPTPQLEVIALAPPEPTPHVELLCYRNGDRGRASPMRSNDIGATRLIFERSAASPAEPANELIFDPDGHHLLLTGATVSRSST